MSPVTFPALFYRTDGSHVIVQAEAQRDRIPTGIVFEYAGTHDGVRIYKEFVPSGITPDAGSSSNEPA